MFTSFQCYFVGGIRPTELQEKKFFRHVGKDFYSEAPKVYLVSVKICSCIHLLRKYSYYNKKGYFKEKNCVGIQKDLLKKKPLCVRVTVLLDW